MSDTKSITAGLQNWSQGDEQALHTLLPELYVELSQIASRYLSKERRDHTLPTSALVHETYLKLLSQQRVRWQNRSHFFAISSRLMRRILVDYARSRASAKRGGESIHVVLDEALHLAAGGDLEVIVLHEALASLSRIDPELAEVTEMRFFGGLENQEIASVLGTSTRTVIRRWRSARAWLLRYLQERLADGST